MEIHLIDLLDGKFRFLLNGDYRKETLLKSKEKFGDWREFSRYLGLNTRNLFGMRRGWEFRQGKKMDYMISSKVLGIFCKKLGWNIDELEKNITAIRLGNSGLKSKISLPFKTNLFQTEVYDIKSALAEHVYIKDYEKRIDYHKLPDCFDNQKDYLILKTNNNNHNKTVPRKLVLNKEFMKEFGKWMGDRVGGARRVGVANKEFKFISDFRNFLMETLEQKDVKIILRCKEGFIPTSNIKKRADKIEFSRTQYGNYAYNVGVPNRELKELIFDILETNLFEILFYSKPQVRYAFYAGLIEAEGSVDLRSKNINIAFGYNLRKERNKKELINLLRKVVRYCDLLKKDGFNPRISRKVCNTPKCSTLKYDIILLNSLKTRKEEVNFIKNTIAIYITYKKKLSKFRQLEEKITKKTTNKPEKIKEIQSKEEKSIKPENRIYKQPEVNIGLVGHYLN